MTEEEFLAQLRADPSVISAVPDAKVSAATVPNDPIYVTNQQSYLSAIGAETAWDFATGNGEIVIAVLDTGIDTYHPEFQDRLWVNPGEIPNDGIDNDGNGCIDDVNGCRFINLTPERSTICGYTDSVARGTIRDDHGRIGSGQHSHGTLVSGIIAAAGGNGRGVTGISWNARIMPIKVLDCGSEGGSPTGDISNIADGIDYARRMGANIINLSLASEPGDSTADMPKLRAAIEAAQDAGIIIVAAAGNHDASSTKVAPGYPAAYTQYPAVIGVGSSNQYDGNRWATFANYGPGVDIAAPGVTIAGTTRVDLGSYGSDQGTSFSTPLIAGAFALLMSRNARLSTAEYVSLLTSTATPAPPAAHGGNWAGAGIVNIGAAVSREPMLITGAALHDWKDVPAGTVVRAMIDGVECGMTATTIVGQQARYAIRVKAAAELENCGAQGKTVTLTVGGLPAGPSFTWPGPNGNLGLGNRDVSSVTDPPGGIVVQAVTDGWSLLTQLEPSGALPSALDHLPAELVAVQKWDPESGGFQHYSPDVPEYANTVDHLAQYDVFWVRTAGGGNDASLNPYPAARQVDLQPGWNAVVYTGTSASVANALSSISGKYSLVMQFDNVTRNWLSYVPGQARALNGFGGMLQLRIYWVYMTEPATLTMQ